MPRVRVSAVVLAMLVAQTVGIPAPTPSAATEPEPVVFSFAAGGDHGANSLTDASLLALDTSGAAFYLALGDLDYDETTSDAAWCDYVLNRLPTVGATFPFQLVAGNHEEQGGGDGYILNHAACLPDRLGSTGRYAVEYFFDYPTTTPLVRVIMIAADLRVDDVAYDYVRGSARYEWLVAAIDGARANGVPWVVVGMHKVCITTGYKACEIGTDLYDLLAEKRVDLVLQAHDHNYQRSKQLALGPECPTIPGAPTRDVEGFFDPDCVVDDGSDGSYVKGAGAVTVVSGTFGRALDAVDPTDPEAPYFARINSDSHGFVRYTVSTDRIDARFVTSTGTFTDSFSILGGPPPSPPVASFTAAPTSGSAPLAVSFTDTSTGGPTAWAWDYGDGATSALQHPTHTYTNAGSYTVTLTATNAGGSSTATQTDLIAITGPPSTSTFTPDADAFVRSDKPSSNAGAATTLRVRTGSRVMRSYVRFNVTGMGDAVTSAMLRLHVSDASPDGGRVYTASNSWSEGAITWSNAPPMGTTVVGSVGQFTKLGAWVDVDVTPAITGSGTYTLVLSDGGTNVAWYDSRETVSPPHLVISTGSTGLATSFTVSPTSGPAPLDVAFTDTSSGSPTSWSWDFGDGTTSSVQHPSHTYTVEGTYGVSLTVTNASGSSTSTQASLITVGGFARFGSEADAFVRDSSPTTNFGNDPTLRERIGSPVVRSYLRFAIPSVGGTITSAKLRLHVFDTSTDGGRVYFLPGAAWSETAINWNNAPAIPATSEAAIGAVTTVGVWVEIDVTPVLTGPGTYTFAIADGSTNGAWYDSRETPTGPELVITLATEPAPAE